jgi:glutamate 5-kinase
VSTQRRRLVVKIGSSSVTGTDGLPAVALLERLAGEVEDRRAHGWEVVVVTSGAVAAGWAILGHGRPRPSDVGVLQAVSAVGQQQLMAAWAAAFAATGAIVGQVLLTPNDFADRNQYLHARQTLDHLLELDVVPVVNENDAVADDEIRFGDNDRLAALVAHLVGAERLVMLTDAPGLLTADPRHDDAASLIEVVTEIDAELEAVAAGTSGVGSGGMASKLAAARIATFSGVDTVIASATEPGVLAGIDAGRVVGTRFHARQATLSARRLWLAFALPAAGIVEIDAGAADAVAHSGRSLLAAGVLAVTGDFAEGEAVEVRGPDGVLVAKGLARLDAAALRDAVGDGVAEGLVVVHRDDLTVLAD